MLKAALTSLTLALSIHSASAADTPGASSRSDPMMDQYHAAVDQKDWKTAAATMQSAISKDPNNPDYHSLYAYSLRKGGTPDMDLVFKHYNEALRLDPKHRGAHEYLGEAYLMVGNVAKAKEELGALDKLCFFGCSEYNELKSSIAAHEAKTAKQ